MGRGVFSSAVAVFLVTSLLAPTPSLALSAGQRPRVQEQLHPAQVVTTSVSEPVSEVPPTPVPDGAPTDVPRDLGAVPSASSDSDLTPSALTVPESAATQQRIEVSWTVQNAGTGTANPAWSDNLYLSTDSAWNASDTYLGISQPHSIGLAASASYTVTVAATIPNVPAGSYYLVLRVDNNGNVSESNEANNDRATPIAIASPDLTPTALTAPLSAATQQRIEVSWTVLNSGTGNAQPSWSDSLYLSADASWDASDTYLGVSQPHGTGLAAGASYTATVEATIPNVPAGPYYLVLRADNNGNVYEANEANNDRATAIAISAPDLTPTALTAPASASSQQIVEVSWTLNNQGAGEARPSWSDQLYLSTNNVWDASDTNLVGSSHDTVLAAGASYVTTMAVMIPNVPAGSYYLVLRADNNGNVYESNEGDNDRAIAIAITTPDLTPTALTVPASASSQQIIEVSWTVKNQGAGEARPSWSDQIYLSTNNVWDGSDTNLAGSSHDTVLAPGASYVTTMAVMIPNVPAGSYYLLLRADRNGNVYESNEANNDRAMAIAIATPDLTPSALTAPATASSQQIVEVSWTVNNQGAGEARPAWTDQLYLSTNNVWDASDANLAGLSHDTVLVAGASYVTTLAVTIPNVPAGYYYLVLRTDRNGNVYESNEANNDRATPIAITTPDLTPMALTAPTSAAAQQQIQVSWTVQNQGAGAARPSWSDMLFLSSDNVWDASDTGLTGPSRDAVLAAGASYTTTTAVTVPNVAAGSYYLVLRTDRNGNVFESNEDNNNRAVAIAVTAAGLTPANVTATAGDGRATIAWDPVAGASSYNVYRATTPGVNKTNGARMANVTSPYPDVGLTNGASYYYVVTAVKDGVEGGESRQVSAVPNSGGVAAPDLTPTALTAPASAVTQQQIQVSWTVQNQGTGDAQPSWSDHLYLSTNNVWDVSDLHLTEMSRSVALATGVSYTATTAVTMPNVPAGSYYLVLRSDRNGNIFESSEANNDRATAIAVTTPDLAPTALTAPASAATQQQLHISWTVVNQGTGDALPSWSDNLYLSTNNVWDVSDLYLTETSRSVALASGASYTVTVAAAMPNVPAGSYYLVLRTDRNGNVYESNEANNDRVAVIAVATPDLTPTALMAPASVTTQQWIELSWTTNNQGTGSALASWSDNLYLSTDNVWDTSDTYLAGLSRDTALTSGSSYTLTLAVAVPRVPAGSYYLVLRTDRNSNIYESNEANNDRAAAITIATPDLTPTALTAPASASTQRQIEVSWTVENQGTGDALPSWSDHLYLSPNNAWDVSDIHLAGTSRSVAAAAGNSYVTTLAVTIPNVPAGSYYLVLRTDRDSNVYESNEANNDRATAIAIATPDLTPTALTAAASAVTQQLIEVSWTVANQGTGDAQPSWSDNLYLSTNNVWDVSDTHLAGMSHSVTLAASSSYVNTLDVRIPNVPAGSYYLVLRTDRNGNVYESNEANNDRAMAIIIMIPDLTPTALTAPASVVTQQQIEVSWTVANQGTGDAQPSWSDNLYLSTDNVWDVSDTHLAGSSRSVTVTNSYATALAVTTPNVPAGSYYLVVRIDRDGNVYESNEANNDRAIPIAITTPDLAPTALSAPASAVTQQQIEVSWTVQNQGTGEALPSWVDHLYSSTNNVWDPQDSQIGYFQNNGGLPTGASYTASLRVQLPQSQPGSRYLILLTDYQNNVYESNEANNERQKVLAIQVVNNIDAPWRILDSEQGGGLGSLDFSPDGLRLAASGGSRAFIWDIDTGSQRVTFAEHTAQIDTVDFSPTGVQVLSGARDGTSRIWDAATHQQVRSFSAAGGQPNPAAISRDGTRVLAGSGLNLPRLWEALSGLELRTFPGHTGPVNAVALSPDGSKALTGSSDRTAVIWDAGAGSALFTFSRHTDAITSVAFSLDGASALTASSDGSIRLWDVATGTQAAVFIQPTSVVSAAFSTDGRYVVSAGEWPGVAYLWEISSGSLVRTVSQGDVAATNGVSMSPDRTLIATTHSDGQVRLWQSGLEAIPLHPVTLLPVGSELPVTLRSHGLYYFQVDAEAGRNLVITLGPNSGGTLTKLSSAGASGSGIKLANLAAGSPVASSMSLLGTAAVSMLAKKGSAPSPWQYEHSARATLSNLHAEIPIAAAEASKYYVLVFAPFLSEGTIDASIRADYTDFHISSVSPSRGGNGGRVTVDILGTNLAARTIVRLVKAGSAPISPDQGAVIDSTRFRATFNLASVETGSYDVEVQWPDQGIVRSLENSFGVENAHSADLAVSFDLPPAVRPAGRYAGKIRISNPSNVDSRKALLSVGAPDSAQLAFEAPIAMALPTGNAGNETEATSLVVIPPLPPGTTIWLSFRFTAPSAGSEIKLEAAIMQRAPVGLDALQAMTPIPHSTVPLAQRSESGRSGTGSSYAMQGVNELVALFGEWPPPAGYIVYRQDDGSLTGHVGVSLGNGRILDAVPGEGVRQVSWEEWIGGIEHNDRYEMTSGWAEAVRPPGYSDAIKNWFENYDSHPSYDDASYWDASDLGDVKGARGHFNCRGLVDRLFEDLGVDLHPFDTFWTTPAEHYFFTTGRIWRGGQGLELQLLVYGIHLGLPELAAIIDAYVVGQSIGNIAIIRPIDPNDKVGPAGSGETRLVSAQETLQYTVNFENMAAATAPVQEMVVVDYLDQDLDWTTLQFSDITYGSRLVTVPDGLVEYATRDLPEPPDVIGTTQGQLAVDVTATFDAQTGRIEWRLKAIDTATGLPPEDPLAGFLPPEDGTGSGQGHVSFSIKPQADAPANIRIANVARIVFDTNDPVETNEVWNTIGVVQPIAGDVNGDGQVDIFDLALVASAFGSSDPDADLNKDGLVNIFDLVIVGMNFGAP